MGAVLFYHLTRRPLEAVLPPILERALAQGWRVAVRGTSEDRLDWLDEKLWMGAGFLPHGRAGGGFDADQPVLLTTNPNAPNTPCALMAVDGAEVRPEEAAALERVWVLFDGADEAALAHARGQWRALTGAGVAAQYWSEESGRWQKKAESGAAPG